MIDSLKSIISSDLMTLKAIIFDLGGVIVDLQNPKAEHDLQKFFHTHTAFFGTALHQQLLRGDISNEQFWEKLLTQFSLRPSIEHQKYFITLWNSAIRGLNPIMLELIPYLGIHYPSIKRYVLSNTDFWHWQYLNTLLPSDITFDKIFLSYEIKMLKPDLQIYTYVLDTIGFSAEECLFIDDSMQNILAAQQLGLKTFHYKTIK